MPRSSAPRPSCKQAGYRVERYELRGEASVSAERGYLRETGNLVFHTALLGVLVAVGIGGGFGFSGQRVVVEGQSFVNTLAAYDSFNPGRFFDDTTLDPYRLSLEDLDAVYETRNQAAIGQAIDFTANVSVQAQGGDSEPGVVKVNEPLRVHGTDVYLLGNGYAPTITVRDPDGEVVFTDAVPFLPQDANLTSIGVVKVPDGLEEQVGMVGFFYPTQTTLGSGAYTSSYPDLVFPVLTLNVYQGDLGIDGGEPTSVYTLDPSTMEQLTGGSTGVDSVELMPGQTVELPNGLGSVTFEDVSPDACRVGCRNRRLLAERLALRELRHPRRPVAGLGARVRGAHHPRAARVALRAAAPHVGEGRAPARRQRWCSSTRASRAARTPDSRTPWRRSPTSTRAGHPSQRPNPPMIARSLRRKVER